MMGRLDNSSGARLLLFCPTTIDEVTKYIHTYAQYISVLIQYQRTPHTCVIVML